MKTDKNYMEFIHNLIKANYKKPLCCSKACQPGATAALF